MGGDWACHGHDFGMNGWTFGGEGERHGLGSYERGGWGSSWVRSKYGHDIEDAASRFYLLSTRPLAGRSTSEPHPIRNLPEPLHLHLY